MQVIVPDSRKHRGSHPQDAQLFCLDQLPILRAAVSDYSLLLSRGYPENASLKLVGDRFGLRDRQRLAVRRSGCRNESRFDRRQRMVDPSSVAGGDVEIDGFNLITTVEAALAGGVLMVGRDGCMRDMASMHGSYRKVAETKDAVNLIGSYLARLEIGSAGWLLDQPVSNSGRLAELIRAIATENDWNWTVENVNDPDRQLIASPKIVVTADSVILDRCGGWLNLAYELITSQIRDATPVDLNVD